MNITCIIMNGVIAIVPYSQASDRRCSITISRIKPSIPRFKVAVHHAVITRDITRHREGNAFHIIANIHGYGGMNLLANGVMTKVRRW